MDRQAAKRYTQFACHAPGLRHASCGTLLAARQARAPSRAEGRAPKKGNRDEGVGSPFGGPKLPARRGRYVARAPRTAYIYRFRPGSYAEDWLNKVRTRRGFLYVVGEAGVEPPQSGWHRAQIGQHKGSPDIRALKKENRGVTLRTMKYIPLFLLIQLVNLCLAPLGWIVCLLPGIAHDTWIFWNSVDPPELFPLTPRRWWNAYVWLAWRNPVSNLRLIPGVSKPGRPLWIQQRTKNGVQQHRMVGWLGTTGYPVCQILWSDGAW